MLGGASMKITEEQACMFLWFVIVPLIFFGLAIHAEREGVKYPIVVKVDPAWAVHNSPNKCREAGGQPVMSVNPMGGMVGCRWQR